MEEGVVESATTISLPSTRPRSARVSFRFFLVAASMLGTDCMYKVLFFPPIEVVRPGARIWNWAELTRWSTTLKENYGNVQIWRDIKSITS